MANRFSPTVQTQYVYGSPAGDSIAQALSDNEARKRQEALDYAQNGILPRRPGLFGIHTGADPAAQFGNQGTTAPPTEPPSAQPQTPPSEFSQLRSAVADQPQAGTSDPFYGNRTEQQAGAQGFIPAQDGGAYGRSNVSASGSDVPAAAQLHSNRPGEFDGQSGFIGHPPVTEGWEQHAPPPAQAAAASAPGGGQPPAAGGGPAGLQPYRGVALADQGVPDVVKLPGGRSVVTAMTPGGRAIDVANLRGASLWNQLVGRGQLRDEQIDRQGGQARQTTDERGNVQSALIPEREQAREHGMGVQDTYRRGDMALGNQYSLGRISAGADARVRVGEALAQFRAQNPSAQNPMQRENFLNSVAGEYANAAGGDPQLASQLYQTDPRRAQLEQMGFDPSRHLAGAVGKIQRGEQAQDLHTGVAMLGTGDAASPADAAAKAPAMRRAVTKPAAASAIPRSAAAGAAGATDPVAAENTAYQAARQRHAGNPDVLQQIEAQHAATVAKLGPPPDRGQ